MRTDAVKQKPEIFQAQSDVTSLGWAESPPELTPSSAKSQKLINRNPAQSV